MDTLWQLQRLGPPAFSPDGRLAVCSVATPSMADNRTRSALWAFPTDGGAPRQLTHCGERDGAPAWSPDGRQLAFLAKREQEGDKDKTTQLYLIAPDGGEARRATQFKPGIEAFKWLPDSRRIVFSAWVWPELRGAKAQNARQQAWNDRKESGYATSEAFYRYWDHHIPQDRVLRLWLLDTQTGRCTDLFEGTALELPRFGGGSEVYDISPDGRQIAFVHDPAAEPLSSHALALSVLDLKTKQLRALVDDVAWDLAAPVWSPDGRHIAFTAAHIGRAHTAFAKLAVLDLAAAAPTARGKKTAQPSAWQVLAPQADLCVEGPLRWAADGASLLFAAEERGHRRLWQQALDGSAPVAVSADGWLQGFDVAGGRCVFTADTAHHPAQLWSRQGASAWQRLDRFNDDTLARVALGEVREVQFTGALGEPVQMWLTFPPGFNPRQKHPVNHVIHGGPFAAAGQMFSQRWNAHVLASAGHVVVQVNYHGSSGFGEAFRHSLIGRQGELELQDIEAATDWLVQQPWVDTDRIVATGGSYGGFLVAWMNGHVPAWPEGRYRAYVCHAGVFDRVATFSADSWPTRPLDLQARYWEDMPRVLAQSPHAFAAHMATPTLVIHGAQDYRVPDCNGLAYYNTLKALGVPARLLWFADENHWILKPQNARQWTREFLAWLDTHGGPRRRTKAAADAQPRRRGRA